MKQGKIFKKLNENFKADVYPFHMPGHKRRLYPEGFENVYGCDITEIEGFDDLHNPNDLIKEVMDEAKNFYGTKATYYLINGSSCGNLAAICALTEFGDKILMAKNCHKSVYNAVKIRNLNADIVNTDDNGEVHLEEVKKHLDINGDAIKLCIITSPTYEGVISDIRSIAKLCKEKGVKLIVDEAHGAHLLTEDFPASAIKCGADIVIQSLHKTLPSLTQTALLHVCSDEIDQNKIREYLGVFESSSPSYVLMGSIDSCVSYMKEHGEKELNEFSNRLDDFYERVSGIKILSINRYKEAYKYDKSKIVIGLSKEYRDEFDKAYKNGFGVVLGNVFRYRYGIEIEMSAKDYVIIMTSIADKQEGFDRLKEVILSIDKLLSDDMECFKDIDELERKKHNVDIDYLKSSIHDKSQISVYVYPPGVPIIANGDIITEDAIKEIELYLEKGCNCYQV